MPYCMLDWSQLYNLRGSQEEQVDYLLDCLQNIIYDYCPIADFWKNLNLQNFSLQNHSQHEVISIVPFINLKEETYSESVGNTSTLLAEYYVKEIMLRKETKGDEMLRFSILMFYFVNASSVNLNPFEFEKLFIAVTGCPATMMVGLYALERLLRVNSELVNNTNVSRYFSLLLKISKDQLLNPVSLRLIAVSLENYKEFLNFDLKSLLKCLVRLPDVTKERR